MAENTTATSKKDLYSSVKTDAKAITDASLEIYKELRQEQELLQTKRALMHEIKELQEKVNKSEEEELLLLEKKNELKPLTKTFRGNTEKDIENSQLQHSMLVARYDTLYDKYTKNQLDNSERKEFYGLPQRIEACFEEVTDLSAYIQEQLKIVDAVSDTTAIDQLINGKAKEIERLQEETKKAVRNTYKRYSDIDDAIKTQSEKMKDSIYGPQDSRDPNYRLNANQNHETRYIPKKVKINYKTDYAQDYVFQEVKSEENN